MKKNLISEKDMGNIRKIRFSIGFKFIHNLLILPDDVIRSFGILLAYSLAV